MMQRNVGVEATRMSFLQQPVITELAALHRELFAPPYVSDVRVVNGIRAKALAFRLGDDVHGGLKPDYLARVIKIEEGLSWSKMFGNFIGTASAFRATLNTVRQDENDFVTKMDTQAIKGLFVALLKYRRVVNDLAGRNVSKTMQASAAFCSNLVDELHELFFVSEHWATIAPDGETILIPAIDKKALADPRSRGMPVLDKADGSVTLLTASGLDAFKAWAGRAADPNNFLETLQPPPGARIGVEHPAVEVDIFGRTGGLPPPHPSYASPVHRVLVELMAIAESIDIPLLQFRANGWRNGAYEARVPTEHADRFLAAVRENEAMGSLRGKHDWWIERIGEQVKVVIPTQPATHMQHFADFSKTMLRKVAVLFDHFQRVHRQEEIDLDALDESGASIRMKLNEFEESFQELLGMQQYLVAERARDPNMRTQESYAVSALLDRLMFSTKPYRDVYMQRNAPDSLAANIGRALNSNVFSLLEHIPGTSERVPKVDLLSTGPRIPFTPVKWIESHQLMISLYALMVDIAGAFDEDSRYPVDVEVNYVWDAGNRRIVFSNPDGRFIDYFRGLSPDKEPHLVPGPAREIYALAKKVAPAGRTLVIIPDRNLMYVPIQVDESAVPVSPSMASISAPHPSLLRRDEV